MAFFIMEEIIFISIIFDNFQNNLQKCHIQLDVLKVKKAQSFGLRQFLVFGSHLIKTHTK